MLKTHIAVILSQMLEAWDGGDVEDVDDFITEWRDEIMSAIKENL